MCFDASLKHFLNAYLLKRTDCERHKKDLAKDMSWTHKARRDGRGCLWSSAAVRGQARTSGSAGSDTASGPWSACFLWLWTQMYQNNWSKKQASTHKNITRAKVTLRQMTTPLGSSEKKYKGLSCNYSKARCWASAQPWIVHLPSSLRGGSWPLTLAPAGQDQPNLRLLAPWLTQKQPSYRLAICTSDTH